jgi:putative endopeptidase
MQRYFEKHGRQPDIDGFTPEQRFFMSWGRIWRNNVKEEAANRLLTMDPHSPGEWRVKGTLRNMGPLFYDAFNVKPGDAMYLPENERVDIW